MRLIQAGTTDAEKRKVYFHLVSVADGMTASTGEATGQPVASINGAAYSSTGIGALAAIGRGRYYATLSASVVGSVGRVIETSYKSTGTSECPGDSVQVVGFNPDDTRRLGLLGLSTGTPGSTGGLSTFPLVVSSSNISGNVRAVVSTTGGSASVNADQIVANVGVSLSAAHSTGSWATASVTPSTDIAAAVDTKLSLVHGSSSWAAASVTSTGIATDVDTLLTASHGTGSWQRLTSSNITLTSPVSSTGNITLHQWDDYYNAESRSLEWTSTGGDWGGGNISNASVEFKARNKVTGTTLIRAGSIVSSTPPQKVRVELSSTQTGALKAGEVYDFQVRAIMPTTGTGHVQTIQSGEMTVGESLLGLST